MEKYRLDGRLGAAANIFRATRVVDGEQLVIKRVPLAHEDAAGRQRARIEFGLAGKLRHPCVARCVEAFYFNDTDVCLAMQFYPRGDLAAAIARRTRNREPFIDEAVAMRWFVNLALALHYLHSHGIVHRDVKSSNCFLEGPADTEAPAGVVLGDFGIAQVAPAESSSNGSSVHDPQHVVSGTPQYMAPELLQSGNAHSFRSDVWSLGCVLYEMLSLRHPFEARDVSGLVVKVVRGNFPPLPQRYSHDVCELVVRLLDVNPATRPAIDEVLLTPFVHQHLRRYYAATVARGELLAHSTDAERRNFLNQMATLGVIPSSSLAAASSGAGPSSSEPPGAPSSSVARRRVSSLSPDRVAPSQLDPHALAAQHSRQQQNGRLARPGPFGDASSAAAVASAAQPATHGRRAGVPPQRQLPRGSADVVAAQLQEGRWATARQSSSTNSPSTRRDSSPRSIGGMDGATATSSSIGLLSDRSPARSEHEAALYEAAREHDVAYVRMKEAQRRGIHGQGTASVKDTVDRVVYGPAPPRVVRHSPLRDGSDSVAGLLHS